MFENPWGHHEKPDQYDKCHEFFVFLLIVLFQPARADKPNTEEAPLLAYVDKYGDKSGDKSVISVAAGSVLPLRRAAAVATVITAADIEVSGATS